jgi:hypothetical protein
VVRQEDAMWSKSFSWLACAVGLAATRTATADSYAEGEPVDIYAWHDARLPSGIGVSVAAGGGVSGFTDSMMRDTLAARVGGTWNVRASIGTHIPLGVDLAYVGSSTTMGTFSNLENGTLFGTAFEGAVRFNILPHYFWNPYVFAGAGWQHYSVHDMRFMTSDTGVSGSDNVIEVPMGVGFTFRDTTGLVFDFRGTYHWTTGSDLVVQPITGEHANLNSWEATANLGYEF